MHTHHSVVTIAMLAWKCKSNRPIIWHNPKKDCENSPSVTFRWRLPAKNWVGGRRITVHPGLAYLHSGRNTTTAGAANPHAVTAEKGQRMMGARGTIVGLSAPELDKRFPHYRGG